MRELVTLVVHLLVTFAKLVRPCGVRAVAAESLLRKHQLLISNRARRRAPNLTPMDRLCSAWSPRCSLARAGFRSLARSSSQQRCSNFTRRWLAASIGCAFLRHRIAAHPTPKGLPLSSSRPSSRWSVGTARREYLDHVFFWNAIDLVRKLEEFKAYYNAQRVHRPLAGSTPTQRAGAPACAPAAIDHYVWRQHCRGLFQTPVTA